MKTLTLTFLLTLTLASCGSSDDKKNRDQIGNLNGQNPYARQARSTQPQAPRDEKELIAETSEELYYQLKASDIDMKRVQEGESVLIKCDDSTILNEISMSGCRIGFDQRDLSIGHKRMSKGHVEDLYDSIYSPTLRDGLMEGTTLEISCKKTCEITDGYDGDRQYVDHRNRGLRTTEGSGF